MAQKHAFHICENIADGIQKESEIGRGKKIDDCIEAKKKESSSGATSCLVVDSSPTMNAKRTCRRLQLNQGWLNIVWKTILNDKRGNATELLICTRHVGFVVSRLIRVEIQL